MQAVFVIGQGPVRVSVKENIRAPLPGCVYHPERIGLDPVKVSMGEKKPLAAKAFLPGIGQTRRIRGKVAVSPHRIKGKARECGGRGRKVGGAVPQVQHRGCLGLSGPSSGPPSGIPVAVRQNR